MIKFSFLSLFSVLFLIDAEDSFSDSFCTHENRKIKVIRIHAIEVPNPIFRKTGIWRKENFNTWLIKNRKTTIVVVGDPVR